MEEWVIIDRLAGIILENCKGCIVEIGMGTSTPMLVEHAKKFKVILYSCDIDENKTWKARKRTKRNRHKVFHGTSIDFMEQFNDIPAIVFIDGWHECELVIQETYFFLERLLPGGVIFLHDTLPLNEEYTQPDYCGDVYKVKHHFEQASDLQCFTWPYTAKQCGLTMLMKKPRCCIDGY